MAEIVTYAAVALAGLAAVFSLLSYRRGAKIFDADGTNTFNAAVRMESEMIRKAAEENARSLRKELLEALQGFQEATQRGLRDFGDGLHGRMEAFAGKLDTGVLAIHDRAASIAIKLDQDIARMAEEAGRNREALRLAIEGRLENAALSQSTAARSFREEMTASFGNLGSGVGETLGQIGSQQKERLDLVTAALGALSDKHERTQESFRSSIEARLDVHRAESATKLEDATSKQAAAAKEQREELSSHLSGLGSKVAETMVQIGEHQRERLEDVRTSLGALAEKQERAQDALRTGVEGRLDVIRSENAAKLDEMRQTVDEKLQGTLEKRLGESFAIVSDRLEQVHRGLGEMQNLATGVGDLKRVLSNVKSRGGWGEVQLGMLLADMLANEQFASNVKVRPDSGEVVEFAVRLPGRGDESQIWLPIDAKFPQEDYDRLLTAQESGSPEDVEIAGTGLERAIRLQAKTICEKYIHPPHTTDFAILYLPTEGLFAETIRRRGLLEELQKKHRVMVQGPTTLAAMLSALQMGFRTLAIEKRSSEVWTVLGAAKAEFEKYGQVWDKLRKQLDGAQRTVDEAGKRTRALSRKLRDVEKLPDLETQELLGPISAESDEEEDEEGVGLR